MREKVWDGTEYVGAVTDAQEVAARLKEAAIVFRNAEPVRVVKEWRFYEMTEEIRDAIAELMEQAAALIGEAYEDAE